VQSTAFGLRGMRLPQRPTARDRTVGHLRAANPFEISPIDDKGFFRAKGTSSEGWASRIERLRSLFSTEPSLNPPTARILCSK